MGITYIRTVILPAVAHTVGSLYRNQKLLNPYTCSSTILQKRFGTFMNVSKSFVRGKKPRANRHNEMQQLCRKQTQDLKNGFEHFFHPSQKQSAEWKADIPFGYLCGLYCFLQLETLGLLTYGSGTLKTKDCLLWPSVFINICIVNFIISEAPWDASHERSYTEIPSLLWLKFYDKHISNASFQLICF